MTDWRTWLTIALVGAPCVGYVVLLIAEAEGRRETGRSPLDGARAWLRALRVLVTRTLWRPSEWRAFAFAEVYPPEAAEAPDDVMAVADAVAEDDADTVEVQRAHPWTPERQWRASEAWLSGAVDCFDWAAAEHQMRKEAS